MERINEGIQLFCPTQPLGRIMYDVEDETDGNQ